MLVAATNRYQVTKREFKENQKGQYLDRTGGDGAKTYFRASEMGNADRKLIYSFFKHQIPVGTKGLRNLRALENGDYVHLRWQRSWEEMGVMILPKSNEFGEFDEVRLDSREDEVLKDQPWQIMGHYDALLDLNIVRAHALGLCSVSNEKDPETGRYEMIVTLDEAYAKKIGFYNADGTINDDYEPLKMVADIKSMNTWGFKRLRDKHDVTEIHGYISQIMIYMFLLNVPFGSIFIEDKEKNDILEVQVVWTDMHGDDALYEFSTDTHGPQDARTIRVTVNNNRFNGEYNEQGDLVSEGIISRIDRIWRLREVLTALDQTLGGEAEIASYFPDRCSDKPDKFPCSWSEGTEKCEFYEHCWNNDHRGKATRGVESIPPEAIWDIDGVKIDSRKLPAGMTIEMVKALDGALVLAKFAIGAVPITAKEAMATALTGEDEKLFNSSGELNLTLVPEGVPGAAVKRKDGDLWAIDCLNCGKIVTFQRLGPGGVKKCPHCNHTNRVQE